MDGGREPRLCTFHVRCPDARHVYLCGSAVRGQQPIVVPLRPGDGGIWKATLSLHPGSFRFRFYVDDGRLVTWFCASRRPRVWDDVLVIGTHHLSMRGTTLLRRAVGGEPSLSRADARRRVQGLRPADQEAAWVCVWPLATCRAESTSEDSFTAKTVPS